MDGINKYFLGSNTNEGFYSLFNELYNPEENWRVYILKGGPGCGKSTLMRRSAEKLANDGFKVERVMCASDPTSYDAIICRDKMLAIVDGTPPHVFEPKYYGAVEEIINLGECLDGSKLQKSVDKIRSLFDTNSRCYRKTTNYLKAACALDRNSKKIQDGYINYDKIYRYALNLYKRELGGNLPIGEIEYTFLTAFTNEGEVTFENPWVNDYKIISVDDVIGCVSGQLMDCILSICEDNGLNVVAGVSPYDTEEIIQVIFPDRKLAIIRKGFGIEGLRTIHASRFTDAEALKLHKNKLNFNRKTSLELRKVAENYLSDAKKIHDEIERIYKEAMDFEKLNIITDSFVAKI
ncbi:MAG: hypothetical protein PUD72_02120 [Oscillospiraceae bacterium]|nr:hypothetical protein [Oscillospiraceae bacterium]